MATRSKKEEQPVSESGVAVPPTGEVVPGDAASTPLHPSNRAASSVPAADTGPRDNALPPQPIPGAAVIGRGIYVKPRKPYELKALLFETEQDHTQLYTSWETKLSYQVPDNCIVNNSPPTSSDQSLGETVIEESWDRFGSELTLNVNAAAGNSLFSIDPTALRINELRSEEDSYYALRSSFIAFWNLSMIRVPSVPALEEEVASLPADPLDPSNRAAYAQIFDKYGSHYVKSTWIGGKASLVFVVAKSSQLTKDEIRVGIQASLGGMLKGEVSTAQKTIGDKLKSSATCKVFGSGGNRIELAKLTSLDPQIYEDWIESVKDNPQVIQLGLAGIWTLVKNPEKAESLKTAYIQESRFKPLTAIIPITLSAGDENLYFLKDDDVFEYRLNPKPGERRTTRNPQFINDLKRTLKCEPKLAKFTRPDAAISLNGFGGTLDGALYLFKHRECVRLDLGHSLTVTANYPKDIEEDWPGVDFDRIDAAVTVAPERIYFFRGSRYIRIDISKGKAPVVGTRDLIKKRWTGVSFERLDTAVYWGNSKVYLFSGDQYIRYDMATFKADPGYPKFIESNYVEDWEIFE